MPALLEALHQIIKTDAILTDEEDLKPFKCEGLSVYHRLPMVVVLPNRIEQAQAIRCACHEHKVTCGANTGLSSGALPANDGLLLSLAKFNRVLNVDMNNAIATVQPAYAISPSPKRWIQKITTVMTKTIHS